MKDENGEKYISANEINKFAYCPYQYYYEKKYGIKELRLQNKEFFESNGLFNETNANFKRGISFHNNYRKGNFKITLQIIGFLLILIIIFLLVCIYFNFSFSLLQLFLN